jgi:hypothetical protein
MVVSVAWEQLSIVLDTQMRTTSLLRSLESLVSRRDKAGQKIATPREILDRALRSKEREAALHSVLHHYLPESADQEGPAGAPLHPVIHRLSILLPRRRTKRHRHQKRALLGNLLRRSPNLVRPPWQPGDRRTEDATRSAPRT